MKIRHNADQRVPYVLDQTEFRPLRRILLAVAALVAVGAALGFVVDSFDSDPGLTDGSGTLVVDGIVYTFTPTTCRISDEDFSAAGTGFDGTDRFWISASSVGLDLTVGTESEVDRPAADQLWLISHDDMAWSTTGQSVTARANMSDHRSPQSTTVVGSLELECGQSDI